MPDMKTKVAEIIKKAKEDLSAHPEEKDLEVKYEKMLSTAITLMAAETEKERLKADNGGLTKRGEEISDIVLDEIRTKQLQIRREALRKGGNLSMDDAEFHLGMIAADGFTIEQKLGMTGHQLTKYMEPAIKDKIKTFQELNDDALIIGTIRAFNMSRQSQPVTVRDALQATKTYTRLKYVAKSLSTGGSATGTEWIPTGFSSQLIDVVTVKLKVAALFDRLLMPTNPYKLPIATTDDVAFFVSETNSDNLFAEANKYPVFTPGTGNVTLTAKKFAAITIFSEEEEEDSIIAIIPILRKKVANSIANAEERVIVDGDDTATHMDYDVSLLAATDARKAFKGLRKFNVTQSNYVDLTTFNLANVRGMRLMLDAAFAENADELVYVVNVQTMLKMLTFPELMTLDKYGPAATILTGEVAKLDGMPVITSKYMRADLTAGVNTNGGANNQHVMMLVAKNAFLIGDRRDISIEAERIAITGQKYLVTSRRMAFVDIYPSAANNTVSIGRNIPA